MRLNYFPLGAGEATDGLGKGFSLNGFVKYDRLRRLLILASGERYRLIDEDTMPVTICQLKLDTVRVHRTIADGVRKYSVALKSGEIHHLVAPWGPDVYVPEKIESPLGHALHLRWESPGAGHLRLKEVFDEEKRALLRIDYPPVDGESVAITQWPDSADEKVELALHFENGYLRRIINESLGGDGIVWTLGYDADEKITAAVGGLLLNELSAPTGLIQRVKYEPLRMKLQDGGDGIGLPAVVMHTLLPGVEQPAIQTYYEYSAANYLGHGARFNGSQGGADELFDIQVQYHYQSVEKLLDKSLNPVSAIRSTTRKYNNFHLLISEEVREGNCVFRQETAYPALEGQSYQAQPATFQLPIRQTTSWETAGRARTESVSFEYDDAGQLVKQTAADGSITVIEYYPRGGEPGRCPAEPEGFSRYIKSKTVFPPISAEFGDETASRTEYVFQAARTRAGSLHPEAALQKTATYYVGAPGPEARDAMQRGKPAWTAYRPQRMAQERYDYFDAPEQIEHGRIKTRTVTTYGPDQTPYEATQHFTFEPTHSGNHDIALKQTVSLTVKKDPLDKQAGGSQTVSSIQVQSALTGRLLSETSALGNTVSYHYDRLGRLQTQTVHPDLAEYRSAERWDYRWPAADAPAQLIHTDALGNQSRSSHDGLGRVVREEVCDRDNGLGWQTVAVHQYDEAGRAARVTMTDVVHDRANKPVTLRKTVERGWDQWGQLSVERVLETGLESHHEVDPIGLTVTSWLVGTDRCSAKGKQFYSKASHDPTRRIVLAYHRESRSWDVEDKPYSATVSVWDGAHRLRRGTDEMGNHTQYRYDVWGRMVETVLPDGSALRKQYAPFSQTALPTRIGVVEHDVETVAGTQRFDGLGRLKETVSGGRPTRFEYANDAASLPHTVTGADGRARVHAVDDKLNEALKSVTATCPDQQPAVPAITQSYSYRLPQGQLQTAEEAGGAQSTWNRWPSGRLREEGQDIRSGGRKKASYRYSLTGSLQSGVGIDGAAQARTYQTAAAYIGKLIEIADEAVTVTLEYNGLQQLSAWTAKDKQGHALTTTVERDSLGREIKRTLAAKSGEIDTLLQFWYPNGQLHQRQRFGGSKLLCDETFAYDARNRLKTYTASGSLLPRDAYGKAMLGQRFEFDAFSNIRKCTTLLDGGGEDVAEYLFENKADPCQLSKVTHTASDYPAAIDLKYDKAGRLVRDEAGRTLHYDALGRLSRVDGPAGNAGYSYDAHDRLVCQSVEKSGMEHRLYYQADRLVNEWMTRSGQKPADGDSRVRLVYGAGGCAAQVNDDGKTSTTSLTGADGKGSIVSQQEDGQTKTYCYTPYGYRSSR
ncbi:RHS repeat domain-containing protein [Chromobacterium sp. ATCC 53434]|uniref:RHS repeat domain-containing protein n=1 Tax=Chromobacterium sp. (strain ATCC 53434 / SC 14030) TaxID=2059672 RepID=UPI001F20D770|nr:RHS repeat domain-containing protein [Chromobacterium sp. ATCC 53434]